MNILGIHGYGKHLKTLHKISQNPEGHDIHGIFGIISKKISIINELKTKLKNVQRKLFTMHFILGENNILLYFILEKRN
jgi:hypothetical protein